MGNWMHLESRAAFRKGIGRYRGFSNPVTPGMWVGGIVGLKSILGVKRRPHAMYVLSRLEDLGYITYDRDPKTKKLEEEYKQNESGESAPIQNGSDNCVADLDTITRAYFSHGRNCKYSRNCINDCQGWFIGKPVNLLTVDIGALRPFWDNPFLNFNTS